MTRQPTCRELKQRIKELENVVSAKKQIKKNLLISEIRFKEIFRNSKNGIIVYEAVNDGDDFDIIDCNPACEKIEHLNREELIGKTVLQVFPNIKEFGLFDVMQRVWKTGNSENHPVANYEDERISGWKENFVYRLPSGEIVVIYTDETDRIKAEKELEESNDRMSSVLLSLPTGVMIIDANTCEIMEANPQALSLLGLPWEKIVSSKYQQFICHADVRESVPDPCTSCESSEAILIDADGKTIPIYKTIIPLIFDDKECFIINFIDISHQKMAESERIQKEKLQGVIEMAGAVCHKMSQPLQAVTGLLELITLDVEKENPLFIKLEMMQKQIDSMGEITKKLMKITRYETQDYIKGKIIDIEKATLPN